MTVIGARSQDLFGVMFVSCTYREDASDQDVSRRTSYLGYTKTSVISLASSKRVVHRLENLAILLPTSINIVE